MSKVGVYERFIILNIVTPVQNGSSLKNIR